MRGKSYCDHPNHKGERIVNAKCNQGHDLPIIGVTIDLIVEHKEKIWLVKRKSNNWALPGGFVEYNETLEEAAKREAREELGANKVTLLSQFHTYGDPNRDTRRNISVVYIAQVDKIAPSKKELKKDGIKKVQGFPPEKLPSLAFDHNEIINDYLSYKQRLLPLTIRRYQHYRK